MSITRQCAKRFSGRAIALCNFQSAVWVPGNCAGLHQDLGQLPSLAKEWCDSRKDQPTADGDQGCHRKVHYKLFARSAGLQQIRRRMDVVLNFDKNQQGPYDDSPPDGPLKLSWQSGLRAPYHSSTHRKNGEPVPLPTLRGCRTPCFASVRVLT